MYGLQHPLFYPDLDESIKHFNVPLEGRVKCSDALIIKYYEDFGETRFFKVHEDLTGKNEALYITDFGKQNMAVVVEENF